MRLAMASFLRRQIKHFLPGKLRQPLRKMLALARLAWRDIRHDFLGQIWPMKPNAISFMANDICNAHCVMCLIWKQKRDKELSVEEFRQILAEPLFSHVQDIGITGGEPTLRQDLPELFRVIAERSPRIGSVSLITNAIRENEVQKRVLESARICREYGIGFSVMISLDGVDEVHDINRGRSGNFQSAINCINVFRQSGLSLTIGCTITKGNAAYVDDLLDWAIDNGIPARFRVAEFIQRLYNASQNDQIRNFTPLEHYHLGLFFYRLMTTYEADSTIGKTYASILGMLAGGRKRSTGCPYHTDTVILTSRGELLYCSPKSPNLGEILTPGSASRVYFRNLNKRRDIRRQHCDDCIHDYHVPVSFREKVRFYLKHRRIHRVYNCSTLLAKAGRLSTPTVKLADPKSLACRRVLIVGWYGTETAGDKAILWSIVSRLKARSHPPDDIAVASFHPWVTEWTKRELELSGLRVVETYSKSFETAVEDADEVVIGGGPLMDLESLNHMLFAFIGATINGAITRVEGCGIGPLNNPRYISVVREILRLSRYVTLRDSESVLLARETFFRDAMKVPDPAEDYVEYALKSGKLAGRDPKTSATPVANFFLREWPRVYADKLSDSQFDSLGRRFEEQLLLFMEELVDQRGFRLNLLPMNTLADGGDDRILNRRLSRQLLSRGTVRSDQVTFTRLPIAPLDILNEINRGALNVCMRYHSVFFAEALDAEYLAIDYTGGGKISAFLADRGKLDRLITLDGFASGAWRERSHTV
jgi:MoaA/NifB/PqqE/SkfB family radical SAM enzyme/polysaccharide pyruvyl transferase WcaK-like protein